MSQITRPHWKKGEPDEVVIVCDFCGRLHTEKTIEKIITMDHTAICSLCVELCNDIIAEGRAAKSEKVADA